MEWSSTYASSSPLPRGAETHSLFRERCSRGAIHLCSLLLSVAPQTCPFLPSLPLDTQVSLVISVLPAGALYKPLERR
jgi:hypothetical protein